MCIFQAVLSNSAQGQYFRHFEMKFCVTINILLVIVTSLCNLSLKKWFCYNRADELKAGQNEGTPKAKLVVLKQLQSSKVFNEIGILEIAFNFAFLLLSEIM